MKFLSKSFLPILYFHIAAIMLALMYQNCTGGIRHKEIKPTSHHLPYEEITVDDFSQNSR